MVFTIATTISARPDFSKARAFQQAENLLLAIFSPLVTSLVTVTTIFSQVERVATVSDENN